MLPEIILLAKPEDPLRRDTDLPVPDLESLLILFIDGRIQPVRRQPHHLRQKFPGPCDSFPLKIIAEGKVPQHLKKGAVARCLSYILQISGPDTLLTGRHSSSGWDLLPGKIGL